MFFFVYLISGAAALLYEVAWLRLLALTLGHTAAATGTVLAAFMGGLGLGAWIGGRIVDGACPERAKRVEGRALRLYAWLEIAIAVCALVMPLAFAALQPVLAWAYRDGSGGALYTLTRVALCFLLLIVPTTAMGATFPAAVRWFAARPSTRFARSGQSPSTRSAASAQAGAIYAANTIGATLGAALTGFVLLPIFGLRATTFVGVALNLIAGAAALAIATTDAKHTKEFQPDNDLRDRRDRRDVDLRGPDLRGPAIALAVSGFVAMVYEVTWTRILAMVLGPTTYAFSAVLVAFILGLAIGSAAASALVRRVTHAGAWLAGSLLFASVSALAATAVVDRLPLWMAAAASRPDATFAAVFAQRALLVVALQIPMAIGLGAAFPFALACAASDRAARAASIIYASNTMGAIAGTLAATFLLVPAVGIQSSIRIAAVLAIVTGGSIVWRPSTRFARSPLDKLGVTLSKVEGSGHPSTRSARSGQGGVAWAVVVIGALALAVLMPSWNQELLANGGYRYAASATPGDLESGLEAGRLLYYREGAAGTVSVRELPGAISLAIDGKVDASNAGDMLTQKLLAHLPLLMHPNPQEVLIVGLGSGVTLGAALTHPIVRADVVEISPEVVEASEFFARDNHRALGSSRARLILGDGRSHLLQSRESYDVIISEPSNPWMAGVATLFTSEFFSAARDRLADDGLFCQWAQIYNIAEADLQSIVATFLDAFPDGTAWLSGASDLLLVGSKGSLDGFERRIGEALARPGVSADLAEVSLSDRFTLFSLFVGDGSDLRRYAGRPALFTDDRLTLEYSAPHALYGRFQDVNFNRLQALTRQSQKPAGIHDTLARAGAAEWRNRGQMNMRADVPAMAYRDFRDALSRDASDAQALEGFGRAAAATGQLADAETFLDEHASRSPNAPLLTELSRVQSAQGRLADASAAARQAALLDPQSVPALRQLAAVYADQRDAAALAQLLRIVERSPAHRTVTLYCQATLAALRGDLAAAAQHADRLVMLDPRDTDALNLAAVLHSAAGRGSHARDALEASLRIEPRNLATLVRLGQLALQAGDLTTAVDRFEQALFLRPTLPMALQGLADAFDRQGRRARAAALRALIP